MSGRLPPDRPGRLPDPDDDDGIPLEGFEDKPRRKPQPVKPLHKPVADGATQERCATCWCCQGTAFQDRCVKLAGKILPVCVDCWEKIPAAERIKVGLQMIADDDMRPLKQIAALVLSRIKGDAERAVDGDDISQFFGN